MHLLFLLISVLGLSYFLLAKRVFNWFSVAYFSACVYFLPGFFGYTSYGSVFQRSETTIGHEAYIIMIVLLFMILMGAIINDLFPYEVKVQRLRKENCDVLYILLFLAVVGLIMMFITTGAALFDENKQTMLEQLNRYHILFETAIMVGCTLAFNLKKWPIFALFCLFIGFDVFIGNRMAMAMAFISIFTLWLAKQGKKRLLIRYWKQGIIALLISFSLFFYKLIAFAVKSGDLPLLKTILSDPLSYRLAIMNSEPFVTQTILNEVTLSHYSVGMDHFTGLLNHFLMFAPELGLKERTFNDMFQADLFPEVDYGMANNIWAEMWSSGGWPLLLIFMLFYVLVLRFCCRLTAGDKKVRISFVAVMSSFWAFYIHRNDFGYEFDLEKRVILIMVLCLVISWLFKQLPLCCRQRHAR